MNVPGRAYPSPPWRPNSSRVEVGQVLISVTRLGILLLPHSGPPKMWPGQVFVSAIRPPWLLGW